MVPAPSGMRFVPSFCFDRSAAGLPDMLRLCSCDANETVNTHMPTLHGRIVNALRLLALRRTCHGASESQSVLPSFEPAFTGSDVVHQIDARDAAARRLGVHLSHVTPRPSQPRTYQNTRRGYACMEHCCEPDLTLVSVSALQALSNLSVEAGHRAIALQQMSTQ